MNRLLTVVAVSFAMCLAACGSSSKTSTGSSSSPTTAASSSNAGGYSYGGAAPASPTTAAAASSTALGVAMNAKVHQNIIVDSAGKTVYIYKPDGTSTTSKVPASLKMLWPAVMSTSSSAGVGSGLTASKATVNSDHQVAYNGHLLYTFKADPKAGSANGQGLGGVWYVVSTSGTPIT